jgi:hypothetical protein
MLDARYRIYDFGFGLNMTFRSGANYNRECNAVDGRFPTASQTKKTALTSAVKSLIDFNFTGVSHNPLFHHSNTPIFQL